MAKKEDNRKVLTELTKKVAAIADENMRGRESPDILFDLTVTIVTHLAVQLGNSKSGGEKRFRKWASDTFSKVLERNGATKARVPMEIGSNDAPNDDEDLSESSEWMIGSDKLYELQ